MANLAKSQKWYEEKSEKCVCGGGEGGWGGIATTSPPEREREFRTVAMATVVSQHIYHLSRHLISRKSVAKLSEISRKDVFTASNWNIIENRV